MADNPQRYENFQLNDFEQALESFIDLDILGKHFYFEKTFSTKLLNLEIMLTNFKCDYLLMVDKACVLENELQIDSGNSGRRFGSEI